MLSKASKYALRSLIYICQQAKKGERVTLQEVAQAIQSPAAYTSKILQQLVAAKIVQSTRGGGGGFTIDKSKIGKIKLIHIIDAIEGAVIFEGCFLGLPQCSDKKPCPVHHLYKPIRKEIHETLLNVALEEIVQQPGRLRKTKLE